jgi:NAD(P)-dependent dehydrogenase (short-subunit alcohol dehydrogenase family)
MGVFKLFGQISFKPPVPTADLSGKCVIVTGANVGLGKEAVKQSVRRGAAKVIAMVRSSNKGEAALVEIEAETKRPGVAEIWELDYSNYASVKAFCARVAQLDRLDAMVLNAGVATKTFEMYEGGGELDHRQCDQYDAAHAAIATNSARICSEMEYRVHAYCCRLGNS